MGEFAQNEPRTLKDFGSDILAPGSPLRFFKNEGDSGDIHENKGTGNKKVSGTCEEMCFEKRRVEMAVAPGVRVLGC